MRKTQVFAALSAALLMSNCILASAQRSWSLIPRAGINITNMTETEGDPKFGFAAGVDIEYRVNELLGVSGGLAYSQQGAKGSESGAKMKILMDYVDIPLLVNIYVVKGLALKTGLQPGILINDKAKVDYGGVSINMGLKKFSRPPGPIATSRVLSLPCLLACRTSSAMSSWISATTSA